MLIELTPEERARIEAAFFRVELLRRDIQQLLTQLRLAEQEAQAALAGILKEKGYEASVSSARPIFENFALKYIEIPDQQTDQPES